MKASRSRPSPTDPNEFRKCPAAANRSQLLELIYQNQPLNSVGQFCQISDDNCFPILFYDTQNASLNMFNLVFSGTQAPHRCIRCQNRYDQSHFCLNASGKPSVHQCDVAYVLAKPIIDYRRCLVTVSWCHDYLSSTVSGD